MSDFFHFVWLFIFFFAEQSSIAPKTEPDLENPVLVFVIYNFLR